MCRTVLLVTLIALNSSACWTHRVRAPSPVTDAGPDSLAVTTWSFFWRSNDARPSPECVTETLKEVEVRGNWGFSLIRAGTLGLVAPASFERRCAAPMIDPPPGGDVESHGATHVATGWGYVAVREPAVHCGNRPIQRVALRPNPLFDLIAAATVGLVAPARVRAYCAEIPDDDPPPPEARP